MLWMLGQNEQSRREVTIFFQDGTHGVFGMDEDLLILGKVPYGTYQIQAKDILRIEFTQPSSE